MLLLFTQVLLVCGAFAFPAAQEAVSCEHDSLYTSLSRDGGDFCSSMVRTPCEVSSTPTQFKSYSSAKLSSYCACLMTSYASYGTAALTATGQSNGTGPYTSWPRSENGGDEGESKTNSDDDSATETGGASASTDLPTDSAASGSGARSTTQSDMAGSDTGSMTAKVTRTSYDSSQKTSTTATGDASSTDDSTDSGSGRATSSGERRPFTTASNGQPSNGTLGAQSSSNGSQNSSQRLSIISANFTDTRIPSFTYTVSMPVVTSGNISGTAAWNSSVTYSPWVATLTIPPFITPSGFNSSTISHIVNATQTGPPPLPAANFTQVTRTGAIIKPTCYQMPEPQGGSTRRALLHNTNLREQNATIPFPYIESVDFQTDGVDPLYLTLRDAAEGTHYIDVSNRSYIAIVDSLYNAMIIDAKGIHFSTKKCEYDVSITIDSMYQQLAALSGQVCSTGSQHRKRMNDADFNQTLYLRDQCNNPIKRTVRRYPSLRVGDTDCNDIEVDEDTGRWLFDCTFPGSDSGTLKCEWAVRNDIEEFLFTDPFGGACPDLSTVITTLEANGQDFINPESLRTELYNQGLDDAQKAEANLIVIYYEQLWEILKQAFSKLRTQPPGKTSAIQEYIDVYNRYRNFEDDICEDLHAGDMPLKMSLRAGVTTIDAIARLNWAPENPKPFNVTVQDPAKLACCSPGSDAKKDESTGTCEYPFSAHLGDTGCVCGKTASGASVAFEITECENFVSECENDDDCSKAGHPTFVCLTGSCCGGGVCADPYECAQNGSALVRPSLFF
ncbi:hypothetical protein M441DRAFT_453820 [Trichoderma asperellum CBS 433.97]|uniref:Uncharacterized protein n=1 Tax=Trichoderma asperellum (strain ATCC 204424 / CBS 433.97 / NBRC 101777) TaxID=1042311 RepID=A0A2T3ZHE0_TRIA4|nr:hypothetical protein M441DRAFT_453820 [Trichoderma asperellum CBS 433.97]PTB44219.1 hypothetical protein M441DRAFT_453820 [Trichoderma asperellum CBS 433.97]